MWHSVKVNMYSKLSLSNIVHPINLYQRFNFQSRDLSIRLVGTIKFDSNVPYIYNLAITCSTIHLVETRIDSSFHMRSRSPLMIFDAINLSLIEICVFNYLEGLIPSVSKRSGLLLYGIVKNVSLSSVGHNVNSRPYLFFPDSTL